MKLTGFGLLSAYTQAILLGGDKSRDTVISIKSGNDKSITSTTFCKDDIQALQTAIIDQDKANKTAYSAAEATLKTKVFDNGVFIGSVGYDAEAATDEAVLAWLIENERRIVGGSQAAFTAETNPEPNASCIEDPLYAEIFAQWNEQVAYGQGLANVLAWVATDPDVACNKDGIFNDEDRKTIPKFCQAETA